MSGGGSSGEDGGVGGGGIMGLELHEVFARINETRNGINSIPSLLIVFIGRLLQSQYALILAQ